MGAISLNKVEKWFGDVQVIKGVDLTIADGEFVVFVGPSGCGKSTLLRMIGGLEDISRGTLTDRRTRRDRGAAVQARAAMVFQSYALYPHMSVRDNMGFPLKTAGAPKAEIEKKVNDAAEVLKLGPTSTAGPGTCPAGSASASPSAAASCAIPRPSCSTSRCRTSTPRCASRCATRSPSCTSGLARP
jgi:multiple sugar transport system ATP-binding protein